MRVLALSSLLGHTQKHVAANIRANVFKQLDTWYRMVLKADWKTSADVKALFGSSSIVTAERVVFNIKGNDYRLVASVEYKHKTVRVLWVGTHREYDRIDVKEVTFERSRYLD